MSKLYLDSGYVNIAWIKGHKMPFNFLVGGRGTGKTYGALTDALEHKEKFIYMRRTDTILQATLNGDFNPMNPVAKDRNLTIATEPVNRYIRGWYRGYIDDNGVIRPDDHDPIGVAVGLSVIGNMRGWDAQDYVTLINDEFIPESHERPLKDEADAFFNAYETINRNREFKGRPPLICFLLSNANDMTNDYFIKLNLIDVVDKMQQRGDEFYMDRNRGITISLLEDSPISKAKQQTALYKLTKGTEYARMALGNEFTKDTHKPPKSRNLIEYKPIVKVGELVIYEHKSRDEYYATLHLTGTCKEYGTSDIELKRFSKQYQWLWLAYLSDNIIFETYTTEALFRKFFS